MNSRNFPGSSESGSFPQPMSMNSDSMDEEMKRIDEEMKRIEKRDKEWEEFGKSANIKMSERRKSPSPYSTRESSPISSPVASPRKYNNLKQKTYVTNTNNVTNKVTNNNSFSKYSAPKYVSTLSSSEKSISSPRFASPISPRKYVSTSSSSSSSGKYVQSSEKNSYNKNSGSVSSPPVSPISSRPASPIPNRFGQFGEFGNPSSGKFGGQFGKFGSPVSSRSSSSSSSPISSPRKYSSYTQTYCNSDSVRFRANPKNREEFWIYRGKYAYINGICNVWVETDGQNHYRRIGK